jgi:hypothetical protein
MYPSAAEPSSRPLAADDVADLLETLAAAGGRLAAELDRIASCSAAVSQATVTRLETLAARLRPAATVRARLAAMDTELLMAGATVWARRRRVALSAVQRAEQRWSRECHG